jgi:hypothetical protein
MHGNKLGIRPRPDPKEKSINEKKDRWLNNEYRLNESMDDLVEEIEKCQPEVP